MSYADGGSVATSFRSGCPKLTPTAVSVVVSRTSTLTADAMRGGGNDADVDAGRHPVGRGGICCLLERRVLEALFQELCGQQISELR